MLGRTIAHIRAHLEARRIARNRRALHALNRRTTNQPPLIVCETCGERLTDRNDMDDHYLATRHRSYRPYLVSDWKADQ